MKKALVAALLTVIVLAVSILPAFAYEQVDASDYTNEINISPIIQILQANGFSVNVEKAFAPATKGIIEFTGEIAVGQKYTSIMTVGAFIENFDRTDYYWGIYSSDLNITFWAGNNIIDFFEYSSEQWDIYANDTLGISFSNVNGNQHFIEQLTVIKTGEAFDINDDITQENWPEAQDFENGYLYVVNENQIVDYKQGNLFATADVKVIVTYREANNDPYTITYQCNDQDLIFGGISFQRIQTQVQQRVADRWDYGIGAISATVRIDYATPNDSFDFNSQTIFRSGSSIIWDMNVTAWNGYNYIATPNTGGNFAKYEITPENNATIITPIWVRRMELTFQTNYIAGVLNNEIVVSDGPLNFSLVTQSESYNLGYNKGYEQGERDGAEEAWNNGYAKGEKTGYNKGFNDGTNNKNTWYNLFFAVVDAPVHIFSSLLNFEIFGVNMRSFALAMLTLGVFLIIIKKVVL